MDEDGHDIGSHTWTHANLTSLLDPSSSEYDPARFEDEINRTEDLLVNITGKKPRFIRPPYGAINQEVYDYLVKRGYIIVMWNMGCNDWYFKNGTIENKIYLSGIADAGALICLHDNKYPEYVQSNIELIGELKQTNNLPWSNPQGRKLIGMEECVYDEHYSIEHEN